MDAKHWPVAALCGLLLPLSGSSQTGMDSLLERRVVRCEDVAVNAMGLFADNAARNELDSAALVLEYWGQKCPPNETLFRSRILLALARHSLIDTNLLYQRGFIENLAYYRYLSSFTLEQITKEAPYVAQFLSFTRAWSTELMKGYSPGMLEHDLAEFYGPDPDRLFPRVQRGTYSDSIFQEGYSAVIAPYLKLGEVHFAAILGLWSPTGELSKLGMHPEVGFRMGGKKARLNYDVTFAFRFLSTPEPYSARRIDAADTLEPTSHFLGIHGSLDFAYDLVTSRANEIQVAGGVGYDGFDAFEPNVDDKDQEATAGSLDLSVGIAYRRYLTSWSYLAMEGKYHFVNYAKDNVVDMEGQAITVRLIYGGLMNMSKRQPIKLLQYRLRQ